MLITLPPGHPDPLVFAPVQGNPEQLFVLLHDDSATPDQLRLLTMAIRQAFPAGLVVLPYGSIRTSASAYHWFEQTDLTAVNYLERVAHALPALVAKIQDLQRQYGVSGEYTALAGFGQGATMALEASMARADLAGRVLAFSGCYASLPAMAPPATTVHLLHGADDTSVPVDFMQEAHSQLSDLQGDSTLDIASKVGHELHKALISQAIYRLQTCIPLRSWKAALGELGQPPEFTQPPGDADFDEADFDESDGPDRRTLH